MRVKIDVFMGVMGSGKDYSAQAISNSETCKFSFADGVREDVWRMIGWAPYGELEYEKFKVHKFKNLNGTTFTGRDLLQRYGTEIRRKEDPDVWVKRLIDKVHLFDGSHIVVTDARFKNEVFALLLLDRSYEFDVKFHFCNYKSDRYSIDSSHESELYSIELTKDYEKGIFNDMSFKNHLENMLVSERYNEKYQEGLF